MDTPPDQETRERLGKIVMMALAIVAVSVVGFASPPARGVVRFYTDEDAKRESLATSARVGVMEDLRAKEAEDAYYRAKRLATLELEAATARRDQAIAGVFAALFLAAIIPTVALIVLRRYNPSAPRLQTLAIWTGVSILCLMILFPPWNAHRERAIRGAGYERSTKAIGYGPVWSPPETEGSASAKIDFVRMGLQAVPLFLIAGTLVLTRKTGGKGGT